VQCDCDREEYVVDDISTIKKKKKDSKYTLNEKRVERLERILMP